MILNRIINIDCLVGMKEIPDNSIDVIITDPPYGISFMGKKWDYELPKVETWIEANRILKEGGYLLCFASAKTYHRMAVNIEDAGFEIRDQIMWIYGSGFPKSKSNLKPAHEPICVARKKGKLFNLNIDDCRIEYRDEQDFKLATSERPTQYDRGNIFNGSIQDRTVRGDKRGRFPANIIFDENAAQELDEQTGCLNKSVRQQGSIRKKNPDGIYNTLGAFKALPKESYNDFGGASRFFYIAKASPSERKNNPHPTVKPIKLISHLIKLYSSEGETVVDLFGGSGTTALSCIDTGRKYLLYEKEIEYVEIANKRIRSIEPNLFNF